MPGCYIAPLREYAMIIALQASTPHWGDLSNTWRADSMWPSRAYSISFALEFPWPKIPVKIARAWILAIVGLSFEATRRVFRLFELTNLIADTEETTKGGKPQQYLCCRGFMTHLVGRFFLMGWPLISYSSSGWGHRWA